MCDWVFCGTDGEIYNIIKTIVGVNKSVVVGLNSQKHTN